MFRVKSSERQLPQPVSHLITSICSLVSGTMISITPNTLPTLKINVGTTRIDRALPIGICMSEALTPAASPNFCRLKKSVSRHNPCLLRLVKEYHYYGRRSNLGSLRPLVGTSSILGQEETLPITKNMLDRQTKGSSNALKLIMASFTFRAC